MEQIVYGDLLFLVNFCMDFQCIFLVTKLLRRPFPLRRALTASVLGALYACAALFLPFGGGTAFFLDLFVCALMCGIVFMPQEEKKWRFLIPFGLYFGVSAAIGGLMSAVATLFSRLRVQGSADTGKSSFSFFLLALLAGLCTFLWGRLCQRRAAVKGVKLRLCFSGRELCVDAFVDTANQLCDPVCGHPVVILDLRVAREFLPQALIRASELGLGGVTQLSQDLARRIHMVPTETVTGRGVLLAIRPDAAYLDTGHGSHAVELLFALCALAAVPNGCKALLPPALLNE